MTITDAITRIYKNTKTNASSYDAPTMLVDINVAVNRVWSLVNKTDLKWQVDDNNNTDLPVATAATVSGQQDYSLSVNFLTVDRVEIMDLTGNWTQLQQFDQHDLKNASLTQFLKTAGIPTQFDLVGTSVFLYPPPNYSQAASIKVYYTRGPNEFTSADVSTGTKVFGFNSLFHDLVPLWVSYDYWLANNPAQTTGFLGEIQRKEQELIDFYGGRDRDYKPRLTVSTNRNGGNWGNQSGVLGYRGGDSNQ